MLRESSSIRHHPAYLLPVHSWQQTMPTVLWHVQKDARSLEQHSESSHSELRKTIQDMHCRCQGRFLHQKCIRLNNQETESHSLSGGGTLNLGLQKPKVGDQQLGLSRNNLPPQKNTHTHTHTPHDKNNCKSFLPSKVWKCTSHAMQTRGSTLQDSPPQPPHDANSKPTTSATTSVQNKYRTPAKYAASKGPKRAYKEIRKTKIHTHQGFLSFYDALLGLRLLLLLRRRRHHRRKRRAPIHRPKKKNLIQFQSSDLKCTQNRAGKDKKNTPLDP